MPKTFEEELNRGGAIERFIADPSADIDQTIEEALKKAEERQGIVLLEGSAAIPVFCGMTAEKAKELYLHAATLRRHALRRADSYRYSDEEMSYPIHFCPAQAKVYPSSRDAVKGAITGMCRAANQTHDTYFALIRGIPFFYYDGMRQEEAMSLWEKLYHCAYEYRKSPAYKQSLKLADAWEKHRIAENNLTEEQIATETFNATGHQEFLSDLQEKLEGPNKLALEVAMKWGRLMQYEIRMGRRINKTMIEESAERVARTMPIPQPKIQTLNTAFEMLASIWAHGGQIVKCYRNAPENSIMRVAADNISHWRATTLDERLKNKVKER